MTGKTDLKIRQVLSVPAQEMQTYGLTNVFSYKNLVHAVAGAMVRFKLDTYTFV